MVADTQQYALLGRGIYTPRQAAHYARLKTQTMRRWIHGNKVGAPAVRAELADDPDEFVTFLDFVQAMAIRAIRLDRKPAVPLQVIRKLVEIAASRYDVPYPLARKHTTYLFDDDIVLRLSDDTLVQITGHYKGHQLIDEVVETYADDLVFDDETGFPNRYVPLRYKDIEIVLDPNIRFGEATVQPCGYSVHALVTALRSEGNRDRAASAYGVKVDDIKIAERYNDWILGVAA